MLPSYRGSIAARLSIPPSADVIPHSAADVALSFPATAPWTGGRKIADVTVPIWFTPIDLPSGNARAVVLAKSSADPDAFDGSLEGWYDSTGAVHFECRSFWGPRARVSTPPGAVVPGVRKQLTVQLSCDGVTAWLNGARFEDGYANDLHVFGLSAEILGVVHANTHDWTIGHAAWGGLADAVCETPTIHRTTLSQAQVEALAGVGPTAPLAHPIWGRDQTSVSNGSVSTLNSAIAAMSEAGGGTVFVSGGPYNGHVVLLSDVLIKTLGQVIVFGSIRTPELNPVSLNGGSTLAKGSRVLAIPNSVAKGDLVAIRGIPATKRFDRDYNSLDQANASGTAEARDSQLFLVESATSSAITFEGLGWDYEDITAGDRNVWAVTPTRNVAIEGDFHVFNDQNANETAAVQARYCVNARFIGCTGERTNVLLGDATNIQGQFFVGKPWAYGAQFRSCRGGTTGTQLGNLVDGFQFGGSSHCVTIDCETFNGRHGCDFTGATHAGQSAVIAANRCAHHRLHWECPAGGSGGGKGSAFGTHIPNKNCIVWNSTATRGGPNYCGIFQHQRWNEFGMITSGRIGATEGALGCYLQDLLAHNCDGWFANSGAQVSIDAGHFENVIRASGNGGSEKHNGEYGSGAVVNTYRNVTEPHEDWQEV